jgi:hypothetical protein
MDFENLKTIEEEEKDRVRKFLKDPKKDFRKIVKKDQLKDFYGGIVYPEYKDLFVEKEPTYYRKDSSLARDYAYRNANPVIIILDTRIQEEKDFRDYTGMTSDFFLKQVENDEIIPLRFLSNAYEGNTFYEDFFEKWGRRLEKKPPVYANAVESVLTGESEREFWEDKENELEDRFKFLKGKKIQPTPELSSKDCIEYFAQRLTWLELIGREDIVKEVEFLLYEYGKKRDEIILNEEAGLLAFHGHQIFSVKAFYSLGSCVTFSLKDYDRATKTIKRLLKKREERGSLVNALVQMYIPLSYFISNVKKALVFGIPKAEGKKEEEQAYDRFKKSEEIDDARNDTTIVENQHMLDLKNVQKRGGVEIGIVDESRGKLAEEHEKLYDSSREIIEAPHGFLKTGFDIGSTITVNIPPTSIKGLVTSPDTLSAINELIRTERIKRFEESIVPVEISVWQEGKMPSWYEIL